ncbi:uncharacterized protein cubi_01719 [Cryptosporidium ubiquitum]|uniref:Uncharacterized protein n=1 Tax=Cryptosporidium ubiquitum TaxID=857276 RepID=A0A1J4MDY9_9CRYT|nr:uncharacterized protein cubi_01719 [Cryptosporidium ubiquitum]OII71244.1 hypothetical protein cubi_01719 [Cryptosporidium ubiquitum]
MANSTKTQDSFESCYSCIFENSQDSQVDSLQETLNSKVFLLPSSYNDIWLVNQLNQLKLISQNDDKLNELNNYVDTFSDNEEQFSSENNSVIQEEAFSDNINNYNFFEKELVSNTKLSDIVKNKLLSNKVTTTTTTDYSNNHNNNHFHLNPKNFSFENQNFFSEEDNILIDELVKDSLVYLDPIYSTNNEFENLNVGITSNNNSNNSSNSNMGESIPNCTNCFTQDEIDGIKEILSQDC